MSAKSKSAKLIKKPKGKDVLELINDYEQTPKDKILTRKMLLSLIRMHRPHFKG